MRLSKPTPTAAPFETPPLGRSGRSFLTGFHSVPTRYRTDQGELLDWLADAHARAGAYSRTEMVDAFARYSASAEHIAARGHELEDFCHRRWEAMRLFGPKGSDLGDKTQFFQERVNAIFEQLYPVSSPAPKAIVHVTCTGYASPSGAQRLVSLRDWGRQTEVIHAYHMGCYAAHPAVRIAAGLEADVVHTELCSLHFDPSRHDPARLVIQSLFADGFMRYQVTGSRSETQPGLELLAAKDEILPGSTGAMAWSTGPFHFLMELSRDVPVLLASNLPRFVKTLFNQAGLDWTVEKSRAVFAIHPGGPRIIELSQKILAIDPAQARWSRNVLYEHGNMSSATLPHIWQSILEDRSVADGTVVVSLGAGPGLTLSGMVFRKV
jgi:predicted naringenin-chalcone synthase